jgi:HlyD family secretion protein
MKKIIIPILLLGALAAWWTLGKPKPLDPRLHGNVDIREVSLGFRVSGKVSAVHFEEGDPVKTGDVLARLDDEPYQRVTAQARAQVQSAKTRLELMQAGYRPEEIAQARALTREREATAANAERLFKRQQELLDTKAVSVQDRDDSEARFREAEARQKSAREQLALLEAGYRKEDIAQAAAELARCEAALKIAELQSEDTVLRAPTNGIILTRAQESGAVLGAGVPVLTLSLQQPVWVRAYVNEPQSVHTGSKVQVFTDARPGKPYDGIVGFISPRAEFTPKNVETEELRTSLVYRIRITIANPDEDLRQGMPVTVKLLTH